MWFLFNLDVSSFDHLCGRGSPPQPFRQQARVVDPVHTRQRQEALLSPYNIPDFDVSRQVYPDGLSVDSMDDEDIDLHLGAHLMALTAVDREFFGRSKVPPQAAAAPSVPSNAPGEFSRTTDAIRAGLESVMKPFNDKCVSGHEYFFLSSTFFLLVYFNRAVLMSPDSDESSAPVDEGILNKDLPYTAASIAQNLDAALLPFKLTYVPP